MCNGKRFRISMSVYNFDDCPQIREQYLHFLQVAEAFELDGLTVDGFYDWALEPFLPLFRKIPPQNKDQVLSLHEHLFPETELWTLRSVNGELTPCPRNQTGSGRLPPGVDLPQDLCSTWPCFSPRDVELSSGFTEDVPSNAPKKVLIEGNTSCFFKPFCSGDIRNARNELSRYKAIKDAELEMTLRIPRLCGLVRDLKSGRVFGLLLSYINCRAVTLRCATTAKASLSLRRKWADQITQIVNRLHEADIVWGDVKPDNVLVDENGDAWVIDFGGGYTQGWVSREKAETIEGDLQGLAKIIDFLSINSSS